MSYADVKARLLTHAQTAAAAVARPIDDVKIGFPLPKGRCVRVYYGGETATERMNGRYTLNSEMVAKITMIAAFWPVTVLDEEMVSMIDSEAEAFSHALRTAIDGDTALDDKADSTVLDYGEPDVAIIGNTRFLVMMHRAITDYVEYTIAK